MEYQSKMQTAFALLERFRQRRWDSLEIFMGIIMALVLLPNTWLSAPLLQHIEGALNDLGFGLTRGAWLYYMAGGTLFICLLIRYTRARGRFVFPGAVTDFADAVCLFSLLYLLDFFLSTAAPFSFERCWWPFLALSPFYILLLFLDRSSTLRLIRLLALLLSVQAVWALFYYLSGQYQFYTPHFGNRTGGTLHDPNGFYPLCLLGMPLCFALGSVQRCPRQRLLFFAGGSANLLALFCTFMRSGWLGLCAMLVILLCVRLPALQPPRRVQKAVLLLLFIVLAGILFLRTRGDIVGNMQDRSTRGRFAIWQVSLRVIARHPLLGSGLSTYGATQKTEMTSALMAFHPLNMEPKSLYLNLLADFGVLGLGLFFWMLRRYFRFYRAAMQTLPPGSESQAVLFGTHLGLLSLLVAGLTDTPVFQQGRLIATFVLAVLLGGIVALVRDALPEQAASPAALLKSRRLRSTLLLGAALAAAAGLWILGSAIVLIRAALPRLPRIEADYGSKQIEASLSEISYPMQDALIAAEDGNFYQHAGVDWEALHRALRADCRAGHMVQGGSTLTMQAVRYTLLPFDKRLSRKLAEIVLAFSLDSRLSKQGVLRLYFDQVTFGLHTAGIASASRIYFQKSPQELTLPEAAFLAGLLSRPPQSTSDVTAAFVAARQKLVFERLQYFFPTKYDEATIARARQEKLVFSWEHRSATSHGGL